MNGHHVRPGQHALLGVGDDARDAAGGDGLGKPRLHRRGEQHEGRYERQQPLLSPLH